jgi:hypothetical protein
MIIGSLIRQTHGSLRLVPNNKAEVTYLCQSPSKISRSATWLPWFKIVLPTSSQVYKKLHCSLSRDWMVLSFGSGRGPDGRPLQHQSGTRPLEDYKDLSCMRKFPPGDMFIFQRNPQKLLSLIYHKRSASSPPLHSVACDQ